MLWANSSASGISSTILTLLPMAVAAASAREVEGEKTMTASAYPKLRECPTVPEEVQTPRGVSSGRMEKAIFLVNFDSPA